MTLAPGAQLTCTGSHTITQADLDAGALPNTANAAGAGPRASRSLRSLRAPPSRPTQNPVLTLDKTVTETTYDSVGDVLHYSYLVSNSGNVRLAGPVTMVDDKTTDEACPNVNTVGNLDAYLDPGESITCSATYAVTQADLNSGLVTNTATASAGGTISNQDSVTVNADAVAGSDTGQDHHDGHLRRSRRCDHLQLQSQEHRQRDPGGTLHGHRRQGQRHLSE